jgi:DNA mismatch repair protein MutS2
MAVAIADYFRRAGCISIVSTHHTALKVYAANTPGVLNAAVGFDENTFAPTFELRVGVPGASAGINIAHKLGLNPHIVGDARQRMSSQAQDVSRFLDRLHSELRQLDSERTQLRAREQEMAAPAQPSLNWRAARSRRKNSASWRRSWKACCATSSIARETVNAVQDRAQALKLSKDAERRIAKMRREFREQFDSTVVAHSTGADAGDPDAQQHVVKHVSVGDTVRLKSLGRDGRSCATSTTTLRGRRRSDEDEGGARRFRQRGGSRWQQSRGVGTCARH